MSIPNEQLEAVYQAVHEDPYWAHLRYPGINLVEGYGQRDPKLCRVLIVGEAPGATENNKGRPFCGPSGRVLNLLMAEAGIRLDDVRGCEAVCHPPQGCCGGPFKEYESANAFVTNVVKYRPPGNRTPSIYDIMHAKGDPQFCGYPRTSKVLGASQVDWTQEGRDERVRIQTAGSLRAEWRAVGGPKVIVCVGGVAHSAMSPVSPELGVSAAAGKAFPARGADGSRIEGYWVISQLHPAYGLRRGEGTQKMMSRQWAEMGEFLREEGLL
jgi:uracil-DNA glycosylase